MKNYSAVLIFATSLLTAQNASAIVFTGTATGSWTNPDATFGYSIANNDAGGTATVNWGTPATTNFNNQFEFDGVGSDGLPGWSANLNDVFLLGDFAYRNGAVTNHDFNGVDLSVTLDMVSPLALTESFDFDFRVTNTPNNTGNPVLDGDIVTVINTLSTTVFNFAGTNYTLEILGFSSDGGATVRTDFSSPEGATANAGIYGRITGNIPEPGSLALVALGLIGLGFRQYRHKA
jgi:hypothetical protein